MTDKVPVSSEKIDREKQECKGATFGSVIRIFSDSISYHEKVAPLHPSKFGNVQGKYTSTFAAKGAAPCPVQRVRFWRLKSADILETRWGPPLFEALVPNS